MVHLHVEEYEEARLTMTALYPEVEWSVFWSHNREEIQFTVINGKRSFVYTDTEANFKVIANFYRNKGLNVWENLADNMVLKIDPSLVDEKRRERKAVVNG